MTSDDLLPLQLKRTKCLRICTLINTLQLSHLIAASAKVCLPLMTLNDWTNECCWITWSFYISYWNRLQQSVIYCHLSELNKFTKLYECEYIRYHVWCILIVTSGTSRSVSPPHDDESTNTIRLNVKLDLLIKFQYCFLCFTVYGK